MSAKAEVKETIEKAARFVRKYRHYPLTQDPAETKDMFYGLIARDTALAARHVVESPYVHNYWCTSLESHAYSYSESRITAVVFPGGRDSDQIPNLGGLRSPEHLDPERKARFDAWFPIAVERVRSGDRALQVLAQLEEIANTPGQLLRMVPGLQQLFVKDALARVNEQTRRSQLPWVWASHDKSGIPEMLHCMTMGMLVSGQLMGYSNGDREWLGEKDRILRGYYIVSIN